MHKKITAGRIKVLTQQKPVRILKIKFHNINSRKIVGKAIKFHEIRMGY